MMPSIPDTLAAERRFLELLMTRALKRYGEQMALIKGSAFSFEHEAREYFFAGFRLEKQIKKVNSPDERFAALQAIHTNYFHGRNYYYYALLRREKLAPDNKLFMLFARAVYFMARIDWNGELLEKPNPRMLPSRDDMLFFVERDKSVVTRYRSERLKGPNDLIVARNGDVYFTDQGQTGLHDPTGRVFRLRADGQLDCVLANGAGPNGLALSVDEKILYVAMTRDNALWRVPLLPDGTTMKVGRFCSYFGVVGPDGVLIDSAGNILVAHASLGCVFVHDRHGELIARIVSCRGRTVTNLAFGPDRKTLFITESETGSILVADWLVPG